VQFDFVYVNQKKCTGCYLFNHPTGFNQKKRKYHMGGSLNEEPAVHLFTAKAQIFQISRCRFLSQIYEL
jgi:site-specific DNA-adenine methylase